MGSLAKAKDTFKKSEAAILIHKMLALTAKAGLLDRDPTTLANHLVGAIWNLKPDLLDGKSGLAPHQLSVAATALAHGVATFEKDDRSRNALIITLGNILAELQTNAHHYPLNELDKTLIEAATSTFVQAAEEHLKAVA